MSQSALCALGKHDLCQTLGWWWGWNLEWQQKGHSFCVWPSDVVTDTGDRQQGCSREDLCCLNSVLHPLRKISKRKFDFKWFFLTPRRPESEEGLSKGHSSPAH